MTCRRLYTLAHLACTCTSGMSTLHPDDNTMTLGTSKSVVGVDDLSRMHASEKHECNSGVEQRN